MEKKSKKNNQIKKFSERVMLATIASSIAMTPTFTASAAGYNLNPVLFSNIENTGATLSILENKGWLESANVEWKAVSGATGYNVYYKSASALDSEYKQLDNELIRQYSSYFRADVLGLSKGDYVIKIVPIINNEEANSEQAVTKIIKVEANKREGFAFSSSSPMGTGSGGYKDDGTVASDAQIVYITADNVNTVTKDVITNSEGTLTTCSGLTDILAKRQKGYDKRPLIIRMVGEIKAYDINGLNSAGYLQLKGIYNVTFEGVGEDATAYQWGFLVRDAHNVEIRNIGVMLFPDDAISLDTDNENIWVHNNDIFYGSAGSDADQAKGDGSCDVKGKSTYVTVSYNHFYDSGKASLCGMSDTENFYVSYHHNWFDHSDSRHPRIRVGSVHVYNNYFDGNSKYGVGVTKGGSAFVEANYFRNCKYPMLISLQGSDVYGGSEGTFSSEAGGMIKSYNNKVEGATRLVYSDEDSTQFDAYLAKSRNEQVPSTYKSISGGNTYNNFDTSSSIYSYEPDTPENVENNVTTYSGRVSGGDFSWNFTEADDTDYKVNTELMAKIKNYKSDLVSIGGNSVIEIPGDKDEGNVKPDPGNNGDVSIGSLDSTGMYSNLVDEKDEAFTNAIYVATNGVENNEGTYDSPLNLAAALEKVKDGKSCVILLKSGTYKFDKQLTIGTSGTSDGYNVLKACKGGNVVLDFSAESYNSNDTSKNDRGIQLNGNYWYIGNVTIKGAADNGMMISGSHNIIERCVFDGNRDTGLQISRSSSAVTDFKDFPSYNYVLNCTSKNNCDPATFENADGFAAKLTCGDGNVFDGCLSYNNSDDGWDLFAKTETGSIGVVTIRNCIAMRNGMTENGTTNSNCDGNGFKLGGSGVPTPHVIRNSLAIENLHNGFTDNNNPSALKLSNCTAFDNNKGGSKNNFSLYRCKDAMVSNCISYTTNGTSDKFVNLSADHIVYSNSDKWYKVTDRQAVDTGASAQRGEAISTGVTASDFINAKVPSVGTDFDELWRNEDGTLNTNGVGLVSESSQYSKFSTDGGIIGTRFTANNKISDIEIKVYEDGETTNPGGGETTNPGDNEVQSLIEHNFTLDNKDSTFFVIEGALSKIKGEVKYNDLTLTQCLKIDSTASIDFTTTNSSKLTLVFNSDFNKNILIDGIKYNANNGILNVDLSAGIHTIKKADTCNLYYIGLSLGKN